MFKCLWISPLQCLSPECCCLKYSARDVFLSQHSLNLPEECPKVPKSCRESANPHPSEKSQHFFFTEMKSWKIPARAARKNPKIPETANMTHRCVYTVVKLTVWDEKTRQCVIVKPGFCWHASWGSPQLHRHLFYLKVHAFSLYRKTLLPSMLFPCLGLDITWFPTGWDCMTKTSNEQSNQREKQ